MHRVADRTAESKAMALARVIVGATVCALALIGWSGVALASPGTDHPGGWTIFPSANIGSGYSSLSGISCLNARHCVAVGGNGTDEALVESWNGRAWSSVPTPVLPPAEVGRPPTSASLNGVSCVSARSCVAAGEQDLHALGPCCERTLIETWSGSEWSTVPSPNVGGYTNTLRGVSCVSSRFCVAVGADRLESGPGNTLVGSWNGTEWSVVPSPNPGFGGQLYGVSCVSMRFCVAVGSQFSGRAFGSLVESWNGTEWSVVPSLGTGPLNGVSCLSDKRCVAVGGSASGTLVESWNGSTWSVLESPNPAGSGTSKLNGVSCVSARSCAAVGSDSTEGGPSQTLVETSKGSKWSIVPSANGAGGVSHLNGVSCVSTESCFAVGDAKSTPEGPLQALVEGGKI
jgi:hypothetical protein